MGGSGGETLGCPPPATPALAVQPGDVGQGPRTRMGDEDRGRDGRGRGGHGGGQGAVCPPPFGKLGVGGGLTDPGARTPPRSTPTLRASFLVALVVGDTHSLSDPLHSLESSCKRERERTLGTRKEPSRTREDRDTGQAPTWLCSERRLSCSGGDPDLGRERGRVGSGLAAPAPPCGQHPPGPPSESRRDPAWAPGPFWMLRHRARAATTRPSRRNL